MSQLYNIIIFVGTLVILSIKYKECYGKKFLVCTFENDLNVRMTLMSRARWAPGQRLDERAGAEVPDLQLVLGAVGPREHLRTAARLDVQRVAVRAGRVGRGSG